MGNPVRGFGILGEWIWGTFCGTLSTSIAEERLACDLKLCIASDRGLNASSPIVLTRRRANSDRSPKALTVKLRGWLQFPVISRFSVHSLEND